MGEGERKSHLRDRFARDNEGKRSCKCDRNGNSAETQPLYRDFNSAVIGNTQRDDGQPVSRFIDWKSRWNHHRRILGDGGCYREVVLDVAQLSVEGIRMDGSWTGSWISASARKSYRERFLLSMKSLWIYI